MKMLIGGAAALFMATAALAQPTTPADPMTGNPAETGAPATMTPADPSAPSSATAPSEPTVSGNASTATGPALTQKDGKWWNGDRKATRAEIAEYQRNNPQ